MSKTGKASRIATFGAASAVALLALASVAWACSAQPMVMGISPVTAAPGQEIRLSGAAASFRSPVEVHWNSAFGPVLGQAEPDAAGSFSVVVRVPEASPGVYTLVLVGAAEGGVGRASFEVIPAAGSGGPAAGANSATADSSQDLWSGFAGSHAVSSGAAASPVETGSAAASRVLGTAVAAVGAAAMASAVVLGRTRRRQAAGVPGPEAKR